MIQPPLTRISFRHACILSLIVFVIYFPISVYINVRTADIPSLVGFFIFPALVSLVYYTLFIIATDRLIERIDGAFSNKINLNSQLPAIVAAVPIALIGTIFSHFIFVLSVYIFLDPEVFKDAASEMSVDAVDSFRRVNNGVTFIILLSITYLIINRKSTLRMKFLEVKAQKLVNENTVAKFEALKNQVSPDFLFNSLESLSKLIHVSTDLSAEFIDKLSRVYRHILEQKDNDIIPLTTELDLINLYAFLVKKRFGERLEINVDIFHDIALRYSIAPLTLQLLIEDVIRHHSMSTSEPLHINIFTEGDYLVVENEFRPNSKSEDRDTASAALQNIMNRYGLLTKKPVKINESNGRYAVGVPLIV